ncbi:MAG: glycosyl transferase [Sorangium cellulosum]|nr:MAG: glycosyl transferase [Sorangium cellulosum]
MRVLLVTKVFPNAIEPAFAPFNKHLFSALQKRCEVHVLATVPWFPGAGLFGRWSASGRRLAVPRREVMDELDVKHPRVAYIPVVGHLVSGAMYAASVLPYVWPLRQRLDVIVGSFAYPDGWAAVALGKLLGLPAVIKVHGTDINVLKNVRTVRPNLKFALAHADAVTAPSRALADVCLSLGAPADRTHVVMNGVDTNLFHLRDRKASREALGIPSDGKWLLFVGRAEKPKGVQDLVEALVAVVKRHPDTRLAVVGDGSAIPACKKIVAQHNLPVHFAGTVEHDDVALWLGACDLLVLPSWAEGTPNVILEALVAGRRVVASDVGGIPAVINRVELGRLSPAKDLDKLAQSIGLALDEDYKPEEIARMAPFGSWNEAADNLYNVLANAIKKRDHCRR